MKKLRSVTYAVDIWPCSNGYFWKALAPNGTEKLIHTETHEHRDGSELVFASLYQKPGSGFETEEECKKDWVRFAKLNGFKKWRWKK